MPSLTMDDELIPRIVQGIARIRRIPPDAIAVDKPFNEQGIDSLEAVTILFEMEEEFDLTLPDSAREVRTVVELASLIRQLKQPPSEGAPPASG